MRRIQLKSYCVLGLLLFISLCVPKQPSSFLRSGFVGLSIPFFKSMRWIAHSSFLMADTSEALQLENLTLKAQIERVYTWLKQEEHLEGIVETERFTTERLEAVKENLLQQSQFLPAKVVFREPANWSSFIWIDVGKVDNERMGFDLISENSPVVAGTHLVGIVEYVGKKRSKVRLITDHAFAPSVCGVQGKLQQHFLLEHIDSLLRMLPLEKDLFKNQQNVCELTNLLELVKEDLAENAKETIKAKGFVKGLSQPLWRGSHQKLQGLGFIQEKGFAFEVGDLLITSGLDGIFPRGLKIGVVSKIEPTRLNEPTYSFEVELAVSNIDELSCVQVIPPCR